MHNSDPAIGPVWRPREERVQVHILVCRLTCVLWKTVAACCRPAGLGDEPRPVFEARSEIAMVDVVLPARSEIEIRKRASASPPSIGKSCSRGSA
jgi:hypothetical protein